MSYPIQKHKIKMEVWQRDNAICFYCGLDMMYILKKKLKGIRLEKDDLHILTVDHMKPKVLGGKFTPDNLITACFKCNILKGRTYYEPEESIPSRSKKPVSRVLSLLAMLEKRSDDRRS